MRPQATSDDATIPHGWNAARRRDFLFAIATLTVAVLIVAAANLYIDRQTEIANRGTELEADARVRAGRVANEISGYVGDVLFLAESIRLSEYLEQPGPVTFARLQADMLSFARQHPAYSQIRWIDNAGREAVRIEHDGVRAAVTPPDRLQDKSSRPYFLQARSLPPGAVYVSRLELNVEDGQIEEPWNPTVRFATPVRFKDGLTAGVFVINIRGNAVLDEPGLEYSAGARIEILNAGGYWLAGAPREKLFGFMFGNKTTMAAEKPAVWRRIEGRDAGRFVLGGTLYAFAVVRPHAAAAEFIRSIHGNAAGDSPSKADEGLRWIMLESYDLDFWKSLKAPESWTLAVAAFLIVTAIAGAWSGARDEKRVAEAALRGTLENLETEVRVRTAAFRESEERFRTAFDVAPHGMVMAKSDRTLIRVNREFANMLGYIPEELEGRDVNSITHEDDRQVTPDTFARLLRGEPYVRYEKRYLCKNGPPVWVEGSNAMVDLGDGSPPYFVGQVIDVTEKREALMALAESESHLRAILDNAANAIVSIDRNGGIVDANRAASVIFGCDEEELTGVAFSDFIPDMDPTDENSVAHAVLRDSNGNARHVKSPGRRRNGADFPAEVSLTSVSEGGERRLIAIIRDVGDLEEIETRLRHAQKMEAVGRLSGGIAHDFNNLLTVILGNLQLLQRELTAAHQISRVDKVIAATRSGAEMTRRLLTFSRQQVLALDMVDINALILNMDDLLSRTVGEHIAITIAASSKELWGRTDANQLESAILNLCVNAMDAMPDGGRLTIETSATYLNENYASLHPEVIPGDYVMIAVSDTGTGIPPEILEHIFEPFFTTKEAGKGTGLGLSTIYGFMKQTGGHVGVYSEVGHGTTFKLYIRQSQGAVSELAATAVKTTIVDPASRRILVVEDEPAVRDIAMALLDRAGFQVVAAKNGTDALHIVDSGETFDLIFSDIVMPGGVSGIDLVQAIRARNVNIPVLLTSGYAERALRESMVDLNAARFITKPYDGNVLLQKVAEIFGDQR